MPHLDAARHPTPLFASAEASPMNESDATIMGIAGLDADVLENLCDTSGAASRATGSSRIGRDVELAGGCRSLRCGGTGGSLCLGAARSEMALDRRRRLRKQTALLRSENSSDPGKDRECVRRISVA